MANAFSRITVSIIVSFIARLLGTLHGNIFCYSAISSAGVVLILPGFTIREHRLWSCRARQRLTIQHHSHRRSRAHLPEHPVRLRADGVRHHLHIVPRESTRLTASDRICRNHTTQGFGLTIGSDFYLLVNPHARRYFEAMNLVDSQEVHGFIINANVSVPLSDLSATFTFMQTPTSAESRIVKGECSRMPVFRDALVLSATPSPSAQAASATPSGRGTASRSRGGRWRSSSRSTRRAPRSGTCSRCGVSSCP